MHTVMLTINVNEGTSRQDMLQEIEASAPENMNIPGLIRTYFGIAEDGKSVAQIYLWQSRADADKFFNHDWDANMSRRWLSAPMSRQDWETPLVVDGK